MYLNAINLIVFATISFINSALVELTCDHVIQFVNGHNNRRLLLVEGGIPKQPKATLMYFMLWDNELSKKAEDWAANNQFSHNPDITISSGRFVTGENIHMTLTTNIEREFNVEEALKSWWAEKENYEYKPMNEGQFNTKEKQVGHYTQMVWSNSIYLGCAVSTFKKEQWIAFLVVCYYGPAGNIINEYPYSTKGEYYEMLQCPDNIPNCIEIEYGRCKRSLITNILRVSSIMNLTNGPEKNITAAGADERLEFVEFHENLMQVPLSNKHTSLK